jgi:DNA-binding transcriptional MocR family regulator
VESPAYFGVLQAIEILGRKAVDVPTCPMEGLDVESLEEAVEVHRVRACVVRGAAACSMGGARGEPTP